MNADVYILFNRYHSIEGSIYCSLFLYLNTESKYKVIKSDLKNNKMPVEDIWRKSSADLVSIKPKFSKKTGVALN